jgi:hypothetical protein
MTKKIIEEVVDLIRKAEEKEQVVKGMTEQAQTLLESILDAHNDDGSEFDARLFMTGNPIRDASLLRTYEMGKGLAFDLNDVVNAVYEVLKVAGGILSFIKGF